MASRNSLSDDWEDVADDNLSVISLSTADPDADAASIISSPDQDAVHREPRTIQTEGLIRPSSPPEYQPHTPARLEESSKDECKKAPEAKPSDAEQNSSVDRQVEELSKLYANTSIENEVDPLSLHKTLGSLQDILSGTAQVLTEAVTGLSETARLRSLAVCNLLSSQVAVLLPITLGYAKAWSGVPQELDLDPNLDTWLTGVRVKVLSLKAEVRAISRSSPGSSPLNLVVIWHELEDYQRKMEDFLPIIQVDYNEFQTKNMNIPIATPSSAHRVTESGARGVTINRSEPIDIPQPSGTSSAPNYSADLSRGPSNQVWLLRHELYHLKDLIQQTMERLSNKLGLSDSGAALAADLLNTYKRLHTTLGTALSNHGSDWIDSGLAGGLTYPEFLGLDAECIRDFAGQLTVMMEDIPRDPKSCWTAEWAAQLESLEILAMVLGATLTPDRD